MSTRDPLIRPTTWPLLAPPDRDGQLDFLFPSYEDSVKQMIRVILLTRPGEQLMHPEFGAGISRFLHEPNTIETRRRLRDAVLEALTLWEPRIAIDEVAVDEVDDQPTAVRVSIAYQLRRTGQRKQLALSMTLGG